MALRRALENVAGILEDGAVDADDDEDVVDDDDEDEEDDDDVDDVGDGGDSGDDSSGDDGAVACVGMGDDAAVASFGAAVRRSGVSSTFSGDELLPMPTKSMVAVGMGERISGASLSSLLLSMSYVGAAFDDDANGAGTMADVDVDAADDDAAAAAAAAAAASRLAVRREAVFRLAVRRLATVMATLGWIFRPSISSADDP